MGAMRKAGIWLGLIEDEDDRGYNGYEENDEFAEEQAPQRARGAQRSTGRVGRAVEDRSPVRQLNRGSGSVTPLSREHATRDSLTRDNLALADPAPVRPVPVEEESPANYRITTLHPTTYNEARTIGERYRDGTPVIMNLSEMEEADAKRLVDFAAGLIFGTRGSFERVTNRVFLLSPPHVQVTAEDKAKIAEGGFFNQSLSERYTANREPGTAADLSGTLRFLPVPAGSAGVQRGGAVLAPLGARAEGRGPAGNGLQRDRPSPEGVEEGDSASQAW
jgi:cell division inhibitor SepF